MVTWWRFDLGLVLASGVGIVIVVFVPRASVPFLMLQCITVVLNKIVAYSHLCEFSSTLILPSPSYVCVIIIPHWL